jgi:hypothetical protein
MNLFLDVWQDSLDGRSVRLKATTYTGQNNTEKRGHTSMPRAGFEPMILVFGRFKTVRALDRAAIGTGVPYKGDLKRCISFTHAFYVQCMHI